MLFFVNFMEEEKKEEVNAYIPKEEDNKNLSSKPQEVIHSSDTFPYWYIQVLRNSYNGK